MPRLLVLALPLAIMCAIACSGGSSYSDRLLLARGSGLSELSLASGQEQAVVAPPQSTSLVEPAISPDGTRIAYVLLLIPTVTPGVSTDLGGDLYIANRNGSYPTPVLKHRVRNEQVHSPAWLPDGHSLLVSIYTFATQQLVTGIYRFDLASGSLTRVIDNAYQPTISHDGARIAFLRTEPDYTVSLWTANIDGSGEEMLAGAAQGLVSFQSPKFSPDGRSIAFGGAGQPQPASRLDPQSAPDEEFVSAAGAGVAHVDADATVANGLPEDIWVMDLTTKAFRKLADLKLDSPSLAWASDSKRVFVFADRGLYAIDVKSAAVRRLGEGAYHGQLDWIAAK